MKKRPDLFGAAIHYEPFLFPLLSEIPGGERARMEKVRTMFAPAVGLAKKGDLEGAAMRFMEGAFLMPLGSASTSVDPWSEIWRDNSRTIPAYGAMTPFPISCTDLTHINAPTLVVQGSETHIDTAMMADQVANCLGNAFTIRVSGANHGIPMRAPAQFARKISGFLKTTN
ncbi:alpha/beta hydrolase [Sedimentitalea sp.]|uniref:alpha/beta hydrolase n=1 Tax=Sedimentitalea sp. TaxID=2048915 RepID=UPI003296A10A